MKDKKIIVTKEKRTSAIKWCGVAKSAVVGFTIAALGYAVGSKITKQRIGAGMDLCFEKDPTLKDHTVNVMSEVFKDRLME